jgi:hypothetical protein
MYAPTYVKTISNEQNETVILEQASPVRLAAQLSSSYNGLRACTSLLIQY